MLQLVDQELEPVHRAHRHQDAAQHPHLRQHRLVDQELFLARAGLGDVEGREGALVGDLAVEHDFGIAGALELLEDHLVHARAGVDERRRDDGERAALLDVARGAEEALGPLQRVGVDAARQHLAGARHHRVVGAREPRDRIEQDDDVALVLDEALRLLDHHLGDLDVAHGGLVEGRAHDLALDRARHVGHFLGPLVDQQDDEIDLGMIVGDGVGDVLHHHRLAGARRRHDDRALALAQRRDEVDDAGRQILLRRVVELELELLVGIERRQIVEIDAMAQLVRLVEIDLVDLEQREIALAVLGRADLALDRVAGAQAEAAHLARTDIDVVRSGQIIRLGRAEEAEAVLQHLEHAVAIDRLVVLGERLQDREHHVLLAQRGRVLDLQLLGEIQQFRRGLGFEFLEIYMEARQSEGGEGEAQPARRPDSRERRAILAARPNVQCSGFIVAET